MDGEANDGDSVLKLDGHEYAMCPGGQYLNLHRRGLDRTWPSTGLGIRHSVVSTNLTAVPCGFDYENAVPGSTIALVSPVRNEFEELEFSEQRHTDRLLVLRGSGRTRTSARP